jgi:hypothetical protein
MELDEFKKTSSFNSKALDHTTESITGIITEIKGESVKINPVYVD